MRSRRAAFSLMMFGSVRQFGYIDFDGHSSARRVGRAVSDGDGKAVIRSLRDGAFRLVARKKGHAPGKVEDITVVGRQSPPPVEVRLTAGGAIEGRVTNTLGDAEPAISTPCS